MDLSTAQAMYEKATVFVEGLMVSSGVSHDQFGTDGRPVKLKARKKQQAQAFHTGYSRHPTLSLYSICLC